MTAPKKDLTITAAQVRREHLADVRPRLQWLYLAGLLIGALVAMLAFIAWLGAAAPA